MNDQPENTGPLGQTSTSEFAREAERAGQRVGGWTACRDGRHKIRFSCGPHGRNSAIREAVLSSHD
jgi:hypothetical protein